MKKRFSQFLLLAMLGLLSVPLVASTAVPTSDLNRKAKLTADFVAFNPKYKVQHAERVAAVGKLGEQVFNKEVAGQKAACSHQVLIELRWLLEYTADFPRIDRRIQDLRDSLKHPENEGAAEDQDPVDGSYGHCYTEWMEKLDASYDYIEMNRQRGVTAKYAYKYLDRVNSPEKLTQYIESVATSDVARTGRDNRKELNGAFVNLIRLLSTGQPAGYAWDPRLKATLLDLVINKYQNKATGWWGESYTRDGKTEFVDDLSVTFHVVQALGGNVPLKDKMATTLFGVKNMTYPVGWLEANGEYSNHNNMDVIVLMRDTWPQMTEAQRQEGAADIRKMLAWCFAHSLRSDGSFVATSEDDSLEEATHFGVGFLARLGYFNPAKRFWTKESFPEAEMRRQKIVAYITSHMATGAAGGTYYSSSLEELTH